LNIALGSANETEYLILLSRDLKYINNDTFEILEKEINIIKSKIYKLKQKLIQQQTGLIAFSLLPKANKKWQKI
jgi:23S rRNA-intervening sequence protein